MLFREIMVLHCENHTKHTHTHIYMYIYIYIYIYIYTVIFVEVNRIVTWATQKLKNCSLPIQRP